MICKRCRADKARSEFGSYQQRADYYCITCREAVSKARAATLEAQARGYASVGNTPEYKREQRRRAAEAAGRVYRTESQRLSDAAQRARSMMIEREATQARRVVFRQLLAQWSVLPESIEQARVHDCQKGHRVYWSSPDRHRQRVAAYKHAHPEARERWDARRAERQRQQGDGTLTQDAVRRLFRESTSCFYCGHDYSRSRRSLDHIEPLSAGGLHGVGNVIVCCLECNRAKRARAFAEWVEELEPKAQRKAERLYRGRFGCEPCQTHLRLVFS